MSEDGKKEENVSFRFPQKFRDPIEEESRKGNVDFGMKYNQNWSLTFHHS